ncbi:hypothetical protein EMPS_01675 [Entomortierella parvispora]|uniref:Carboxylesterase type B domain-containing protein n=1 Tax=Entomortierella parvispora TaxID=205924 RepID=A0A9P3H3B7_9FUNG|nr:hypothetical protein EMPS_01675 [Entomortierella parvispora]
MSSSPPRVDIAKQGTVEGKLDPLKHVVKFLNIPYATVQERWRPAIKPEPWSGVRDATKQGPVSPQPTFETRYSRVINTYSEFDFDDGVVEFDERNCLNLNIYVHEDTLSSAVTTSSTEKVKLTPAAVMVYIHGGSFRDGTNAMDVYDGTNLVKRSVELGRPVIVVTLNYRMNFHGFFACPELLEDLKADARYSSSEYNQAAGNWGLMDQRLAFEWVHAHIAAFGGDTTNITAFGQSVGAVSINYHMLIPQHHGLFHRAIMQSCAMASAPAIRAEVEGRLYWDFLVDHFNIPNDLSAKEKLERLRQIPGQELAQAAASRKLRMFTPYVDGTIVPEDVRLLVHKTELYDRGVKAVIIGEMKDEGPMFVDSLAANTVQGWARVTEKYCPPDAEDRQKWEQLYGPIVEDQDAILSSAKVIEHSLFAYPEYSTLRALSKREDLGKGFALHQYYFDRSIELVDKKGQGWGAHHGVDLVFVFGPDFAIEKVFTAEEKDLMNKVQTMWILFAHGETHSASTNNERDDAVGFSNGITRPVDEFDYHAVHKEAVQFTENAKVVEAHVSRQGAEILEFWEKSEGWTHQQRYENLQDNQGLRSGLLCIAQPGEQEWS